MLPVTYADTTSLEQDFGFKPNTSLREGLRQYSHNLQTSSWSSGTTQK